MAAGSFGFLVLLGSRGEEVEELDDLRGLWQRSPWFALMMVLLMVSMIGVPPLAGRGAAAGDLDNDGRLDVVMSVLGGAPWIFSNRAPRSK